MAHFSESNIPERLPVAQPPLDPELTTLTWESNTLHDQLAVQEDRATGVVKWFNKRKGYGFIIPDSGGADLFVHYSSIKSKGFQSLTAGDEVEYHLVNVGFGRYEAIDVSGPGGSFIQETTGSDDNYCSDFWDSGCSGNDNGRNKGNDVNSPGRSFDRGTTRRDSYCNDIRGRGSLDGRSDDYEWNKAVNVSSPGRSFVWGTTRSDNYSNYNKGSGGHDGRRDNYGWNKAVDAISPGRSVLWETTRKDSNVGDVRGRGDRGSGRNDHGRNKVINGRSPGRSSVQGTPRRDNYCRDNVGRGNGGFGHSGTSKCSYCCEWGHVARDCFQRNGGGLRCSTCGEHGHLEKHCYRDSNSRGGASKCSSCCEWGHVARDCYQRLHCYAWPSGKRL
ncbi:hypothetical protein AQUCO_02200119v1 [Aquilegia coerulea]|uniref:CSD domain-containing protein n=1 Tax=Aquilegia coerulea TaxID=218851 RepID=A0A2G5DE15_AQUCA|nr:hypothetical protein AQUCO_02200119v1 [Aquilegia coerulea]